MIRYKFAAGVTIAGLAGGWFALSVVPAWAALFIPTLSSLASLYLLDRIAARKAAALPNRDSSRSLLHRHVQSRQLQLQRKVLNLNRQLTRPHAVKRNLSIRIPRTHSGDRSSNILTSLKK